ncbi:cytosine deaminase [Clostridium sporogenes]|uniref:cytosine deaminase n=1 Tax=Clostridium sporogenes TaxID=1509 RepID=UPI0005EDBF96|nr:cytosine deaminase [Clostridium sporogenes]NFL79658.1 cytosine deaminase [Clostridium sporogenes]NFU39264.1 cytosine deaminase [Clostridium sporogenes]NFU79171.1 cytosine deaminase [Clostridium sporogenes]
MLIKNVKLTDKNELVDIRIENGIFKEIKNNLEAYKDEEIIDGKGNLALPPFIEPHVHLDTTLTAGEPNWNESGTLFEGIQRWSERKAFLTKEDVKQRAKKALSWQIANGIQHVRTHVDTTDESLLALKAMLEVKEEMKDYVDIQIVAFPQEGILSYKGGLELLEEALKLGADVVGAIPHFEFTREYGVESINKIFELAEKYDALIDVHCDEIDDEQSRFLETVATRALETGMKNKVTASHTTAMHSYNNAYTYKLFRLLKMSDINFVANPLVNTHLQGRFDTYPKRRGVTRVKELKDANINVCFGHDDIFDPWYPLGTGNMLQVLHFGLHVCQIMGYNEIDDSIKFITTNSAKTLNIENKYGIEVGKPGNLIILPAENGYDAIRRQVPVCYSIRAGKIISKTEPSFTKVYLGEEINVNFKK